MKKNSILKPEIDQPLYYVHLVIIAVVILGILQLWQGGEMFTLWNVIISVPLIFLGDVIAHSLLRID